MLQWFAIGDVSLGCARLLSGIVDESAALGRLLWLVRGVVVCEVATGVVTSFLSSRLSCIRRDVLVRTFASDSYVGCRR